MLAALTRLAGAKPLRALHVDHGLQPDSAEWARGCADFAARLAVPYLSVRVSVDAGRGDGLEAAAREARYAALAELLEPGETLLTAHHADDQLETLLFRLLRGTGIRGLRGILPRSPLGAGFVARPLLGFTRAELRGQAERWGLEWLEDPSNRDYAFERNYLRAEVLPVVLRRWPRAPHTALRLAAAAADAESILEETARADLMPAGGVERIALALLGGLSPARQRNALRYAIRAGRLPMPDSRQLEALREASGLADRRPRPDARTELRWPGGEARIYRGSLYLFAPLERRSEAGPDDLRVSADEPWTGPEGRLRLEPIEAAAGGEAGAGPLGALAGLPESLAREGLDVRFRAGGERFKPAGGVHSRKLKQWLQERAVVPWMRDRIPLLYWRGRLVAVADLAVAADLPPAQPAERLWGVRWESHPPLW